MHVPDRDDGIVNCTEVFNDKLVGEVALVDDPDNRRILFRGPYCSVMGAVDVHFSWFWLRWDIIFKAKGSNNFFVETIKIAE
jgi:hypothetical protein